jgi:hypothetical protein
MTRKAWDATGPLDTSLHFAFDWDWFIRAEVAGVNFVPVDRMMSVYRWHPHHKTGTGGTRRLDELEGIYRRYAGERYADLFRHLQPKRVRKGLYRALATRLHPLATETSLVRCAFPIRARNFTNREILDVMSMGIE